MTEGIDISSYQDATNIDWGQVKGAGKDFVIVKMTEGTTYVNPHGQADAAAAKAAGLEVAGYLFFHPSVDPTAQADFYLANGGADLPSFWIDAEVSDGASWQAIATDVQRCHDYLAVQHGKVGGLYDNVSWTNALGDEAWNWLIWLADPSNSDPNAARVCWQYGTGPVPGISGQVDLDRWTGSDADYARCFGITAPAPAPQTAPATSTPAVTVVPRINPPLTLDAPIVDVQGWNPEWMWILCEDGAVYFMGEGQGYFGGANAQPYFEGRKAATLTLKQDHPQHVIGYTITDTAGETYNYPIG